MLKLILKKKLWFSSRCGVIIWYNHEFCPNTALISIIKLHVSILCTDHQVSCRSLFRIVFIPSPRTILVYDRNVYLNDWGKIRVVFGLNLFVSTVTEICYKDLHGIGFCGELSFWRIWDSGPVTLSCRRYDGIFGPRRWGSSVVRNVGNLTNLHGVYSGRY